MVSSGMNLDMSGWEVRFQSSRFDYQFEGLSTGYELDAVIRFLENHFARNLPDWIRITLFKNGPYVAPGPGEENNLSCQHDEMGDQEGAMVKWQLSDTVAYKFVPREADVIFREIALLLHAGVTKIAVYVEHMPRMPGIGTPGL
jgi:hypothetical protein